MEVVVEIKRKVKSSRSFEKCIRVLMRPYFWAKMQKEDLITWLRRKGIISSSQYGYIKDIKNTHKGEKCFIVATGPSLTIDDLDKLHHSRFYSFGMNSCALVLDKTKWVPDMFGIQDEFVYKNVEGKILEESEGRLKGKILVSNNISSIFGSAKRFHKFYLHYMDHKYDRFRTGQIKFSEDCENVVYDGYSIIFSLMQIAIYMGFKELYLLGTDCNYKQKKQHFVETGHVDPYALNAGERLIYVHSKFKEYADAHGVKVINCTRGGMLEVYPRMELEKALKV